MLDWKQYRQELSGRISEIATLTPDTVKGYQTLSNAGKKTNHLDARTREQIAVAVAVALRCDAMVVSQSIPLKRRNSARRKKKLPRHWGIDSNGRRRTGNGLTFFCKCAGRAARLC
jgi:alkylhydroperoxidase family enzyme